MNFQFRSILIPPWVTGNNKKKNLFPEFEERGKSKELVVLLHAYLNTNQSLFYVREAVKETLGDADLLTPSMPMRWNSCFTPTAIVSDLLKKIDECWELRRKKNGATYEKIIIVGHSLGALVARKLYICACGENLDVPLEPLEQDIHSKERRKWAEVVDRIVLLAGTNRGWSISLHFSIPHAIGFSVATFFGSMLMWLTGKRLLIFNARRGAPFLTNLRIQWIEMTRDKGMKEKGIGQALTVQLLGSVDDIVSPEDNIDLVSGREFVYIDVPKSGHQNIIVMDSTPEGQSRKAFFIRAVKETREELDPNSASIGDENLPSVQTDVTDVIFVIHGIRDLGFWTQKIARKIASLGRANGKIFRTETSSYGYFPMLFFILPWRRRAKIEWLMDRYAEALSQYPNAHFSFIGHSNGTYLLAKALEEYSYCRFKHVVFAGSVVRTDFNWDRFLQKKRVERVLNYVATGDWVVALFPNNFQKLGADLGGAGHRGFNSKSISQIKYIKGGHSPALKEDNWDALAHFIVHGTVKDPPTHLYRKNPKKWFVIVVHLVFLLTDVTRPVVFAAADRPVVML